MDEQSSTSELIIFFENQREERHSIRKTWHNGRYYYSILDIITALNVSQRLSKTKNLLAPTKRASERRGI